MSVIKLKRGNLENILLNNELNQGEPVFSLDTKELFISDGNEKHLIGKVQFGLLSEKPTTNIYGKLYFSTDTKELFINDGNNWLNVTAPYVNQQITVTGDADGTGVLDESNNTLIINLTVNNSDKIDNYESSINVSPNTAVIRNSEGLIYSKTPDFLYKDNNEVVTVEYLDRILGNMNSHILSIVNPETTPVSNSFGCSVGISKNETIAIGSKLYTDTLGQIGCVHIYKWRNNTWIYDTIVLPIQPQNNSSFGSSCCLNGDGTRLAVGSNYWTGTLSKQGCVYIFDWNGTNWVQTSQITANDAAKDDYFGTSCSLSNDGNILSVGANYWEGTQTNQGCVYIYDWDGSNWILRSQIKASDAAKDDHFGKSCSLSGDGSILSVGSDLWEGTQTNQGAMYIFKWDGTTWLQTALIVATDAASNDYFGTSCSLSDDGKILAIGTMNWEGPFTNQGCVYIYKEVNNIWFEDKKVIGNSKNNDYFGFSCSLNNTGDILLVGISGRDEQQINQGIVHMYKI